MGQPWRYEEVGWGEQPCEQCFFVGRCEVLVDRTPMCLACADLLVQGEPTPRMFFAEARPLPRGRLV